MATSGNKRKLYLTTTKSQTGPFTWLTGEQSNSLNLEAEMLESTDKSSEWRQFIAGIKGATAEVSVFADNSADSPQHQLIESLFKGESVYCFIGTLGDGDKPTEGDIFEALVSSISTPNEIGSIVTRSISLQVTGEVVHLPSIS
jgi:predicted secreted protein